MSQTDIMGVEPPSSAPPVQAASQVALSMNLHEVSVTFGQTRPTIDPTTGVLSPQPAIEWLLTITLSPTSARNLMDGLGLALGEYKKRYGEIPVDPNQTQKITGVGAA